MDNENYQLFDNSKSKDLANMNKDLYVAHLQAGFTEEQALEIVKTIVGAIVGSLLL